MLLREDLSDIHASLSRRGREFGSKIPGIFTFSVQIDERVLQDAK